MNIMNASFLLRLSTLVTSVLAFAPSNVHNGRNLGGVVVVVSPTISTSTGTSTTLEPVNTFQQSNYGRAKSSSSTSLSAVLEAGLDPMFTTLILGAAIMASMQLNPDQDIVSSAKSLVAEAPPKENEEETLIKKMETTADTATATATDTATATSIDTENDNANNTKDVISSAPKAVSAESTPTSVINGYKSVSTSPPKAVAPKAVAPEEVSAAPKAVSDAPKAVDPDLLKPVFTAAKTVSPVPKSNVPKVAAKKPSLSEIDDLVKEYAESIDPKSISQKTTTEIVVEADKEQLEQTNKKSHPVALSPPVIEEDDTVNKDTSKTPFVVKAAVKVVMPWRKLSNI